MNRHGVNERMRVPTNGGLFLFLAVTICLTPLITACSGTSASPDLAILYNRSAQAHAPDRNPIIAIPGNGSFPELNWAGADYVERVVFIGPPNAGSMDALLQLVKGRNIGPMLPYYPPALIGTFPAVYQMLPRSRHGLVVWNDGDGRPVDGLLDPALWQRMGWGLADPNEAKVLEKLLPDVPAPEKRRELALSLQRRILQRAKMFQTALDRPAVAPGGLQMILVAGDALPTPESASVDPQNGSVKIVGRNAGDGVILRSSALLDERIGQPWQPRVTTPIDFHTVMFIPEEHLNLTRAPVFRDNVLFWLLEDPR
ncbi:hypothetical protein D3OALGA1CA_4967 [Olavius algarvensis associated proteobacterium Delta 3]|nr:hypothetical protein D3OALGA1CA_4967 [Olavius algarvensis associated proteobacterium Delta 3]